MRVIECFWDGPYLAAACLAGLTTAASDYVADRQAAGQAAPEAQAVLDRLWFVARSLTPPGSQPGEINSAELNRFLVVLDRAEPPYFGVTTASEPPAGAGEAGPVPGVEPIREGLIVKPREIQG